MTPAEADQALRAANLSLGQASPQPVDPAAEISDQVPAAGETVKEGTPVNVFFPGAEEEAEAEAQDEGGGGGGGGGGAEPPAVDTPTRELAYDDNRDVLRADGNGKKLDPIADSDELEKDPAFSPDGMRVAYVSGDRILLADLGKPDARPKVIARGSEYADLAWAPEGEVLAMDRVDGDDRDLCLAEVGSEPACIDDPDIEVGAAIHWAPNGKTILAGGISNVEPSTFGVVRWRSSKAFSADPSDWRGGGFVAEDAREAAISPDGKQLAAIALRGGAFQLVLTEAGDLALENAKPTNVRACKLAWLGATDLVVVQADKLCDEAVGALVRLPVSDPRKLTQLRAKGDNPVARPAEG
jgi:hypothetical protein